MVDIPFIKLFQTPNGYYFLDVNQNEILSISKNSFTYLSALLSGKFDKMVIPKEIGVLKAQGYLSTQSTVKAIYHPHTKFVDIFLGRKIGKVTLQLTQNCNFRCKYCVYTEKSNHRHRVHNNKKMS